MLLRVAIRGYSIICIELIAAHLSGWCRSAGFESVRIGGEAVGCVSRSPDGVVSGRVYGRAGCLSRCGITAALHPLQLVGTASLWSILEGYAVITDFGRLCK